jgi:phosphorylcholine metabolism protein LicD
MRPVSHTQFKDKDIELAYELLFTVCDLLNTEGIPYHLEGGTLLGIVRDNQLLPWDHDLDISVPSEETQRLSLALKKLPRKWRVRSRKFAADTDMWKKSWRRIFKVKNRHYHFLPGDQCLDIFIKFTHGDSTYWQAGGFIMKADRKHYQGADTIMFKGHELHLPLHHEQYLEAKYGDWKTPVKDWHLSQEKTINSSNTPDSND